MRILWIIVFVIAAACSNPRYRLPYVNGTEVEIMQDHTTHSTPTAEMFDIRGTSAGETLAAAKAGWVRYVKESGDMSTTADPTATNNYVWIEHPLDYCQPAGSAPPGSGGLQQPCRTCDKGLGRCNEWTLYAHMEQNSVGPEVGDWVTAGQAIGIESDVGFAPGGRHVHFAVWKFEVDSVLARPSDLGSPELDNGDYEDYVAMYGRPEIVPVFCTAAGLRPARQGDVHVAVDCP